MELGRIAHFLENRTILVTGATGFLAKIFVEKIIRVEPNFKKLFLLVRASDSKSATQRLHHEIIGKEVFKVLREKMGPNKFSSFISEKVTAVPGDISTRNLGVKDSVLSEEMLREVDVVINIAANTNFDERYDVAMGINTMGALHISNFAKQCAKIEMLLHVSTAYVSGERGGLILESPFQMGDTLNGVGGLDIDAEQKVIDDTIKQLHSENANEKEITNVMKNLGLSRARRYGWPNTYVFTKAMGEMLLGELKGHLPLIILRPTIITSTLKEPFPGWVEGTRTIDSLAVAYGKGKLTCFVGDLNSVVDVIPADMVVNAMMVAMATGLANQHTGEIIYHIGSSGRNPLTYGNLQHFGQQYFINEPWINKEGKAIKVGKVTVLSTMDSFHRYMTIHYLLFLKGLQLMNAAFCQYFRVAYRELNRKITTVMRLIELYKPYLFFKGIFDDVNAEKLRRVARGSALDADVFCFDPKSINWEEYFLNIHIPGVVKRVFK